jgi:hypothetical protein
MTKSQSTDVLAKGQRVRVYPHGSPDQAAVGDVLLISGNQRSIAVRFDHLPPFAFGPALPHIGVSAEGIVLLAYRLEVGPWIEVKNQGHYEIEVEGEAA